MLQQKSREEVEDAKSARQKKCCHCGEKFSFIDALVFIGTKGSYKNTCGLCYKNNFFGHPRNKSAYTLIKVSAALSGIAFFIFANGIFMTQHNRASLIVIFLGLLGGTAIAGGLIRTYLWVYGEPLSSDPG